MSVQPIRPASIKPDAPADALSLGDRAEAQLSIIRAAMEQSVTFTAVPGFGVIAIGLSALVAGVLAAGVAPHGVGAQHAGTALHGQLQIWAIEGIVALCLGTATLLFKARSAGVSLKTGPGRKFLLGLTPALAAGGVISSAAWFDDALRLVPGIWLCCYGIGVAAAGMVSVRPVPLLGLGCAVVGAIALFVLPAYQNALLMVGFGGLHLVFGAFIAIKHGG